MKKTLFSIFGAFLVGSFVAQTPSPSWQTLQNTNLTGTVASTKFLDVVSPNVVWAVGYDGSAPNRNYNWFTRTFDGGNTFTGGNIFPDTNTYVLANLDAINKDTAWVASYLKASGSKGAIHRTIDGGVTWNNMTASNMFTNTAAFADFVAFLTPSVGIALGDPVANDFEIHRTIDGGNTWTQVPGANIPNPVSGEYGLVNIYTKYGSSNIWFGTNKGRVFRSNDAGQTWNVSVLPGVPTASIGVNDIAFSSPLNGIVLAVNASVTPAVFEEYITSDGGVTWTKLANLGTNLGLNDVCGIPGTGLFASAANTSTGTALSYSKDNGVTWVNWGALGIPYLAIDFFDGTSGWAGTFQSGSVPTGGIYKFNGPTSIFNIANSLCLSGANVTTTPTNMSVGNATVNYAWSSSGTGVAFSSTTVANPVITFTANGAYTITLLATNSTTSSTTTQVVNVLTCSAPTASFTAPTGTLCNNSGIVFNNTTAGSPTPTYTWSTIPATGVTITPSSAAVSPTITFATAGVYSVTLLASNVSGTAQVTQTVNVNSCVPSVTLNLPVTTCPFIATVPSATVTSNGPVNYAWTASPATGVSFSPNAFVLTPTVNFANAGTYSITLKATNISGSNTAVQTISVAACVGINENTTILNAISIFPNPSTGVFNIANALNNETVTYQVTNVLGATVLSGKLAGTKLMDLSTQSKGIYFITFESNGAKATKKIVIE